MVEQGESTSPVWNAASPAARRGDEVDAAGAEGGIRFMRTATRQEGSASDWPGPLDGPMGYSEI